MRPGESKRVVNVVFLALMLTMITATALAQNDKICGQVIHNVINGSSQAGSPSAADIAAWKRTGTTSMGVGYAFRPVTRGTNDDNAYRFNVMIAFVSMDTFNANVSQYPDDQYFTTDNQSSGDVYISRTENRPDLPPSITYLSYQHGAALIMTFSTMKYNRSNEEVYDLTKGEYRFLVAEAKRLGLK